MATAKVLEELSPAEEQDVRTIDVESTFKSFLNRYPGRLSPASVGEYRRRVHRAIEEFVSWMADPGSYAFRPAARPAKANPREGGPPPPRARAAERPVASRPNSMSLEYPLRSDLLAEVTVPRDLTLEEAQRMGAFLLTLAVDFRPAPARGP